jgi:hypothetical protein
MHRTEAKFGYMSERNFFFLMFRNCALFLVTCHNIILSKYGDFKFFKKLKNPHNVWVMVAAN